MKILAVSAHPDDETLGCGGTLLKHTDAGDSLSWLITTKPSESRFDRHFIENRHKEILAVQQVYGFDSVHQLDFGAAELDASPLSDIIDGAAKTVREVQPDRVYIVHPGDVHSDHRITFEAVWAAMKPFVVGKPVEVFCYETMSSSDLAPPTTDRQFLANTYCDISQYLDRKLAAFQIYKSEVQVPPAPRSLDAITARAQTRGATVGVTFAEAFSAMRVIL